MLGGLRATHGERVVTRFRTYKTGALLAYLAYYAQRPHSRDALIELFWPGTDPRQSRSSLGTALSALRQTLTAPGCSADALFEATRDAVRFKPEAVTTDVADFEAALRAAARAGDEPERLRHFSTAVAHYGGELLPDFYEEWIFAERERLAEAFLRAVNVLIADREAAGDLEAALKVARRAGQVAPAREETHQTLIRLLVAAGRHADARRQYHALSRLTQSETGEAPSPATRALLDAAAVTLPAPSAPRTLTASLPCPTTLFFGREREITQLVNLLEPATTERSAPRLITLTGLGGSGKTRLALEVAARLAGTWDGAVWFVPLEDVSPPAAARGGSGGVRRRIAEAIWDALALPRSSSVEPLEQVAAALVERAGLLLLDSLEHLVTDAAAVIGALLHRAPLLTCLATSRQRLGLAGEQVFPVPPLPMPETAAPVVGRLFQYPSVQLYVDRAWVARPDFALTPENAAAVAELCARLEGIPLAIELAAARAAVLTPQQTLARLSERLDLLVSGQFDVAARHRSLRATLEWSYGLLEPSLRRFFVRLAVFRGGWSEEAAAAVCGEPRALEYLERLRECSLVLAEEIGGEIRFRMLETLREYGREQCNAGEEVETEGRHAAYFSALAERAEAKLGGAEQEAWLNRLEQEHDNFRAALDRSLATSPEAALRLGAALRRFWQAHDHQSEGREWLAVALQRSGVDAPPELRARALETAGVLAMDQGDYADAAPLLQESLAIWQGLDDRRGIASSIYCQADLALYEGRYEQAEALFAESLALYRELGDRRGAALSLSNLGPIAATRGELRRAGALLRESVATLREVGDCEDLGYSLIKLGFLYSDSGDYPEARRCFEECRTLFRAVNTKDGLGQAARALGELALREGDLEAARPLLEEALACHREIGQRRGIASALLALGQVALRQSDLERAQALLEEGLAIARELGDRLRLHFILPPLVTTLRCRGDLKTAHRLCAECRDVNEALGCVEGVAVALATLGAIAREEGEFIGARALLEESLAAARSLEDRAVRRYPLYELGVLECLQEKLDDARAALQEAIALYRERGEDRGVASCLQALGEAALRAGETALAKAFFEESLAFWRATGERLPLSYALHGLAEVARREEDPDQARALLEESVAIRREIGDRRGIALGLRSLAMMARDRREYREARRLLEEGVALLREVGDRWDSALCLEATAAVDCAEGMAEQAARRLGAAALFWETICAPRPEAERATYEQTVADARRALGDATFGAAWEAGRAVARAQRGAPADGAPLRPSSP